MFFKWLPFKSAGLGKVGMLSSPEGLGFKKVIHFIKAFESSFKKFLSYSHVLLFNA